MRMHAGTTLRVLVVSLALLGCASASRPDAGVEARSPLSDASAPAAASGSDAVEACVDRWLASHKLDRYGEPEGTMYAGGDPTFDEATGVRTPRIDRIFQRHPAARAACASAGATPASGP